MALLLYKPFHFTRLQRICLQTKFELSKWTLSLSVPISSLGSLNELPIKMALLKKKPCHFYGRQKICLQAKFELSRWTLALLVPIFLFQSLNKLGPLVAYPKTAMVVRAHMGQDQSTQVSSQSVNIQDHFDHALCRTVDNPYTPANAKKKKWMPYGHQ